MREYDSFLWKYGYAMHEKKLNDMTYYKGEKLMYKKIILGAILFSLILFVGCEDMIQNIAVKRLESPNSEYTAIAFIREAGATTSFSPQVSVIKSNQSFKNKAGNVFRGNHSEYIDIEWIDDSTLKIFYNCGEKDIFKKEVKVYGIRVSYEKIN